MIAPKPWQSHAPPPPLTRLPAGRPCQGSRLQGQLGMLGGGPARGGVAFPQHCPSIKDACAGQRRPPGAGGRGRCEHSATVKAGQTRLCPPGRGAGGSVNGLLPALPRPAPACSSPLPQTPASARGPARPSPPRPQRWPASTNVPLSLLSLWLFRVPSLLAVGNRGAGPQSRGQARGGGETNPASGR